MKRRGSPVTAADIKEYAQNHSDFGFEMRILRMLKDMGLGCEHSGTYHDPLTNRARQFDIRAWKIMGCAALFAVECKNLSEGYPLVIHSVPRPSEDAFHEVLIANNVQVGGPNHTIRHERPSGKTVRIGATRTPYEVRAQVGKAMDQVGYRKDGGEIEGGDSEVFQKLSQAINSSAELIDRAVTQYGWMSAVAVVPILVVPDGRLWEIRCDGRGIVEGEPRPIEHISYLIRHNWVRETGSDRVELTLSHIELVTVSGLKPLIERLTNSAQNIFL